MGNTANVAVMKYRTPCLHNTQGAWCCTIGYMYNRLQAETNDSLKPCKVFSTLIITTQRGRYMNRTLRNES
ncbi:hypothetical protein CQP30_15440 [Yersinia pestis]|uniref:Uncharacterized protein n=3 Tax=Yersinia pseudotuberculosis complex TaxID=1649845 RepID=A0A384KRX1_YERPE|nr:hypothetical protein YPC_1944 [Yersinia pestis biovar Medievalis str. Harbin 35]ANW14328.1 hypothetical protein BAY22_10250 [Yersinia pestis]AXY32859.1 hypothetical protein CEQ20_05130 [Yersinia pseudotuberculosis]EDM42258.1 hypothetical protein YPE_0946 [Yersinia pestis CA88-4125]EEO76675.1 hypothetical protein YP516_1973 [Yersinia pestis Nepal516]EEO80756.1 hypothetical protein YPF_2829 [Yersinia pestis biovar Orientalis str. India 195]EEO84249.1 hypothetical protein YPH_0054 [Yersinia p